MHWKKLGQVYSPNGEYEWAQTHAYLPTPLLLDSTTIRVYCAFLDKNRIGRIGFVDVDSEDPTLVKGYSSIPVLDVGDIGKFDEHGVSPTSIVKVGNEIHLYYLGWQRLYNIPYYIFTGLAISKDGGQSFERYSKVPILDRSPQETFLRSCGSVIQDKGIWKMWYGCGSHWIDSDTGKLPWYEIRYLESADGLNWNKRGKLSLSPAGDDEFGFGRPHITVNDSGYTLWSSVRRKSSGYRCIYAKSNDGINWIRDDNQLNLDISSDGWDSQMICFPAILETNKKTFLFYNGNQYGQSGFGVAQLIDYQPNALTSAELGSFTEAK